MVTITVSGTPGSGKTTVAQLLHEKLRIPYIYSGLLFRETAEKYKMSLEDFGKYCEKKAEVDKELDARQVEILKEGNVILEGRLAGWLAYKHKIPSFKIAITTDIKTRAERIVKREKGDAKQREKEILERERSENARYKKYYNIDLKDFSVYDLVIDSSDKTPEEIVNIIVEKINM